MSHMVVYRSADGRTGYFQAEDLDRAVAYVEHLRNVEAVDDSRLYRMEEIPIEFKTYYRVEIGTFPAEDDEVDLDEAAHLSASRRSTGDWTSCPIRRRPAPTAASGCSVAAEAGGRV